jgi:hypothetical protein
MDLVNDKLSINPRCRSSSWPSALAGWRFGPQMAIRMGDWKLVKAREEGQQGFERRASSGDTTGAQLFNLSVTSGKKTTLPKASPIN